MRFVIHHRRPDARKIGYRTQSSNEIEGCAPRASRMSRTAGLAEKSVLLGYGHDFVTLPMLGRAGSSLVLSVSPDYSSMAYPLPLGHTWSISALAVMHASRFASVVEEYLAQALLLVSTQLSYPSRRNGCLTSRWDTARTDGG